jgi:hypothetical protein
LIVVAIAIDYLGRLQRPDVSNQGTLQVVAHIDSDLWFKSRPELTGGNICVLGNAFVKEFLFAFVAQLVEHWSEVPGVGGSNPSEGTTSLGLSGVNREPAEYGLLV